MNRRQFLGAAGATAPLMMANAATEEIDARNDPPKFGLDLWSVRSQGWDAFQYVDHAVEQKLRVIQFADARTLGGLEPEHVRKVKAYADKKGVLLEMGMGTICPTSSGWSEKRRPIEPWILQHVKAAKMMGSPLLRCLLGSAKERKSAIPLEQHVDAMLNVLRNIRSQVTDMGVKMAIENHSGDMQGRELAPLIEAAGKDWVGVTFDSGNPIWTIEDPMVALENLAPYILTSHLRDSYVWVSEEGVGARWWYSGRAT